MKKLDKMADAMIHVVSGLAVNEAGHILMGKRRPNQIRPSLWELPGGKVEDKETAGYAIQREWHEELGLRVVAREFIVRRRIEIDVTIQIDLYVVIPWEGRFPDQIEPREHTELAWVDPVHAMQRLPCSPGYYVHYRPMMSFLGRDWALAGGVRP